VRSLRRQTPSYWGMVLAHCGFAAVVVGVVATTQYSIERDLRWHPGDSEELAGIASSLLRRCACADRTTSPMARASRCTAASGQSPTLLAEKRRYLAPRVGDDRGGDRCGLFRDLYVAMGEPVGTRAPGRSACTTSPWCAGCGSARWHGYRRTDDRLGSALPAARAQRRGAGWRMASRLKLFLPLALFVLLARAALRGLSLDPQALPSALIDRPLPSSSCRARGRQTLSRLTSSGTDAAQRLGYLVHLLSRRAPVPAALADEQACVIYGINYKDDSDAARRGWRSSATPTASSIVDAEGTLGLDLGVYGAPETYFVDAAGVVRYRHVGVIDERIWTDAPGADLRRAARRTRRPDDRPARRA
jgi:cytochrome c biogenesis protein CcmG/thiol:disulfide interchange protein DsbE